MRTTRQLSVEDCLKVMAGANLDLFRGIGQIIEQQQRRTELEDDEPPPRLRDDEER